MEEATLVGHVEGVLREADGPLKAAEICSRLVKRGVQIEKKSLNSILYGQQARFQVDADYRWSRVKPTRSSARSTKPELAAPPQPIPVPVVKDAGARFVPPPIVRAPTTTAAPSHSGSHRTADQEQERVVQATLEAHIVVEAGPGYGKTDVACARVARLLETVEPTEILLLSFTRTAVREMRNRVHQLAKVVSRVGQVSVRTIDSFSAELRRVCTESVLGGDYEKSIVEVVDVLSDSRHPKHAQALAELKQYKHILVDEAQDLVGARAALIALLLRLSGAGWTVFYDPAQAIYGWSEHEPKLASGYGNVLDELRKQRQRWETVELKTLHRTRNKKLAALQTQLREIVLRGKQKSRADAVREALAAAAAESASQDELVSRLKTLHPNDAERTLVLFRTRAEALQLAHDLAEAGVPHRLRLGRLPQVVAPWVAACLTSCAKPRLSEADFGEAWNNVAANSAGVVQGWDVERAWRALRKVSQSGKFIETEKIADAIAWKLRTEELTSRDIGPGGVIVGTIHGSKGREAELVTAHFCREGWDEEDAEEEARVLYVGVTRARTDLEIVETNPRRVGMIDGRAWHGIGGANYLLEVGQPEDIDAVASCGGLDVDALEQQQAIASYSGELIPIAAYCRPVEETWRWVLVPNGGDKKSGDRVARAGLSGDLPLGALSTWVNKVFPEVAKRRKAKAAKGFLFGLYWYDTTTVAVRCDDPRLDAVPAAPWGKSRMWLAPVVMGFGLGQTKAK